MMIHIVIIPNPSKLQQNKSFMIWKNSARFQAEAANIATDLHEN